MINTDGNVKTDYFESNTILRPALDSTTAIQLQNAAGTSVLTVDTTNNCVGIGTISLTTGADVTLPTMTPGRVGGIYAGTEVLARVFQATAGAGGQSQGYNLFLGGAGNSTLTNGAGVVTLASYNIGAGFNSMTTLTTGYNNVSMGATSLRYVTTGWGNTALGTGTLFSIVDGNQNVAVGTDCAVYLTSGVHNTAVGAFSLYTQSTAHNSTALGYNAGYNNIGGGGVFLGAFSGWYETEANKLFVDNAQRASEADGRTKALIYGIFNAAISNQYLTVNGQLQVTGTGNSYIQGDVGVGTMIPGAKLEVNGTTAQIRFKDSVRGVNWDVGPQTAVNVFEFKNGAGSVLNYAFTNGNVGIGTTAPATLLETENVTTLTSASADAYSAAITLDPGYTAATALTVTRHNYFDIQNPSVAGAGPAAVTDAAVFRFDASEDVHKALSGSTAKASASTVDAWMKVNISGSLMYCPCYLSTTA